MARFPTAPAIAMEQSYSHIRSVGRALGLLRLMAGRPQQAWSLDELSRSSGLAKSTVHRVLETLVDSGFVEHATDPGFYRLGLQAAITGAAALRVRQFSRDITEALTRLQSEIGETVGIAVLSGSHAVTVVRAIPPLLPTAPTMDMAGVFPAYASAGGKMLLAGLSKEARQSHLGSSATFDRYTTKTITTMVQLDASLDCIRRQGFALDDEEFRIGQLCLCVPVPRAGNGPAVHGLGVSAPIARVDRSRLLSFVPRLESRAKEIGGMLSDSHH